MRSGRTPGPDGWLVKYYKIFSSRLVPILKSIYDETLETASLPLTLTQATISLILKKDKNPLDCSSYRHITLHCCDSKKKQVNDVIPSLIHQDQTGFIPGQQPFFNLRQLFIVMYSTNPTQQPEVILSLDIEKAFDRMEWGYLVAVIKRFGFGETFSNWIRILYCSPMSAVKTNGSISAYFPIYKGTHQGCCLSPFLFDLVIELLALAIRDNEGIKGITRGNAIHKTALYADDLLLFVANPSQFIPHLLQLLQQFGSFSGCKLNLSKSLLFPINYLAEH